MSVFLFLSIQLTEKIKKSPQGAVKMLLSVSYYVRVFLTGKNKNFSSRGCIYALHLLNMCKDIFEPAEKCFLQHLEIETRREKNEI